MDAAQAVSNDNAEDLRPAALLRGTAKGLEIHVDGGAALDAVLEAVKARLDEAPAFFRGSDCRIKVEAGPLPAGCLSRLDELAVQFDLRIVEVGPARDKKRAADEAPAQVAGLTPVGEPLVEAIPQPQFAAGSGRANDEVAGDADVDPPEMFDEARTALVLNPMVLPPLPSPVSAPVAAPVVAAPVLPVEVAPIAAAPGTRLVIGPVRSGVILEHHGHLIIFGDVNPGAEVRAEGNIVVLGRLRGTAHAGIGQEAGFILALRLEPQQLRVGRKVARAGDSDTPANEAEIAYLISNEQIVVERFTGKLPRNLAASI